MGDRLLVETLDVVEIAGISGDERTIVGCHHRHDHGVMGTAMGRLLSAGGTECCGNLADGTGGCRVNGHRVDFRLGLLLTRLPGSAFGRNIGHQGSDTQPGERVHSEKRTVTEGHGGSSDR